MPTSPSRRYNTTFVTLIAGILLALGYIIPGCSAAVLPFSPVTAVTATGEKGSIAGTIIATALEDHFVEATHVSTVTVQEFYNAAMPSSLTSTITGPLTVLNEREVILTHIYTLPGTTQTIIENHYPGDISINPAISSSSFLTQYKARVTHSDEIHPALPLSDHSLSTLSATVLGNREITLTHMYTFPGTTQTFYDNTFYGRISTKAAISSSSFLTQHKASATYARRTHPALPLSDHTLSTLSDATQTSPFPGFPLATDGALAAGAGPLMEVARD